MAQIRGVRPEESLDFLRSVRVPFLDPLTEPVEDWVAHWLAALDPDRAWVAVDGGRFVGNCLVETMDVSVPAGPDGKCPVLAMGGVSAVGVHPTHRRRGLLTAMMSTMLEDCRSRGEPVAGLIASESGIYGRFGFGCATEAHTVGIARHRTATLVRPPDVDLRLLDPAEAAAVIPPLFERHRRRRAGETNHSGDHGWADWFADHPSRRHGDSAMFHAVCDGGYVSYRIRSTGPDVEYGTVVVADLRGDTPDIEAALWEFVFSVDLTDRVLAPRRPSDEPLRWRLADLRQLQVSVVDDRLYIRILDTAAALTARGYHGDGRLVFDVLPAPAQSGPDPAVGRWVLEVDAGRASCRRARARERTGIRLDLTALGALYMGAFAPSTLAAAGRIEETSPGALALADRLLTTRPAPLTVFGF